LAGQQAKGICKEGKMCQAKYWDERMMNNMMDMNGNMVQMEAWRCKTKTMDMNTMCTK